jgi:hypothetical protein
MDDTNPYVLDPEVGRALASSTAGNVRFCSYANTRGRSGLIVQHVRASLPAGARPAIEFGNTSTPRS